MGFGYNVFAENVVSICKRNHMTFTCEEGGEGYGGLHYTVVIQQ